ncbi:hypothetical protein [Actinacidiphila bryophytorum]|uniref:hypothetical protein n=1 Tax=Actinacidiphila bryophytorum TaxID=1436133 RepID=UPI0021769603|nr:hypothetical protein [Actinacidiphila bryophytorum]UWE07614.1 hypothetical protein NYE86_01935 [Actinacidiphila bryophytorum]
MTRTMTTAAGRRSDVLAGREASGLTDELRLLARKGLPLEPGGGWPRLTALASVAARAGSDSSPAARIEALDLVLRHVLARLEPEGLREPAKALFGMPPAEAGSNLTHRREVAARVAGREVNHFRKRVEPQILGILANAMERDAAAQSRPWASPPPVRAGRRRRDLPRDVFAWEAAEHEEALTRLWACVYALRAELLAVERQSSMGDTGGATDASDAALWRYGQLQAQARRYRAAYGGVLLPDGQVGPHELAALAGWTPKLSPRETTLLADAASAATPHLFLFAVQAAGGGNNLLTAWRTSLIAGPEETR